MTIGIGINGFGRIGRSIFRILQNHPKLHVVGINDLFENEALAYLLKYDTVMGVFEGEVTHTPDAIVVNGRPIRRVGYKDPSSIPWRELGVDIVIEATGHFKTREALTKHLSAGAKRVLLTVPPDGTIDAMVVMGVNDRDLKPTDALVSNASCTTNCLAPIAKVLDDAFGIKRGLMTTVHAYTNDQRLADASHSDFRRARAAAENIIPTTTGAARAVGKIMPHLKGKLDGMASRVPVPDGSLVDLVVQFDGKKPGPEDINAVVKAAADGPMKGIVEYCTQPVVSSDIIGNPHSSIFDSLLTQSRSDGFARVVSWYDNEWGYSNRCVDLIEKLASHL